MRVHLIIGLVVFLTAVSSPAWAADVSVDCNAGQSINAALASLPRAEANTITVSGTCTELVGIRQFDNLTLIGTPGATLNHPETGGAIVSISRSRFVRLRNLRITGGAIGVIVGESSASIEDCLIERASGIGIVAGDTSKVVVEGTTIKESGFWAIRVDFNANVTVGKLRGEQTPTRIERNARGGGIWVRQNGHLSIFGSTMIVNNPVGLAVEGGTVNLLGREGQRRIAENQFGIFSLDGHFRFESSNLIEQNSNVGIFLDGGFARFREFVSRTTIIRQNGGADPATRAGGILATNNAAVEILGPHEISNNNGAGIFLTEGSSARIFDAIINNNAGNGVRLVDLSVARLERNTIRGNSDFSLFCSPNSHASGEIANADRAFCPGFNQSPEPTLKPPEMLQ